MKGTDQTSTRVAPPTLKYEIIYRFTRLVVFAARILPRRAGLAFFGFIGSCAYHLATREARRTRLHLQRIFAGQWSQEQIERTTRRVFYELGRNAFDALYLSRCSEAEFFRIVTHDDPEKFRQSVAGGKGIVAITGHMGCFELLLQTVGRLGIPCFAIGQKIYDPRLEGYVRQIRSGPNISYMHRTGSSRDIVRRMRQGEVFGVLIDQDTRVEGEFAPFLGVPAHTPSAPMRMAMRYGVPVFVWSTARMPDGHHHVSIHGPLELADSGNFEADLVTNLTRVNDLLSAAILAHPEQWVWMHRRWHKRPPSEKAVESQTNTAVQTDPGRD